MVYYKYINLNKIYNFIFFNNSTVPSCVSPDVIIQKGMNQSSDTFSFSLTQFSYDNIFSIYNSIYVLKVNNSVFNHIFITLYHNLSLKPPGTKTNIDVFNSLKPNFWSS